VGPCSMTASGAPAFGWWGGALHRDVFAPCVSNC